MISPSSDALQTRCSLTVDGDNMDELVSMVDACIEMKMPFDLSIDISELSKPELLDAWSFIKQVLASHAAVMCPDTHSLVVIGSKDIAASAPRGAATASDIELYLRQHGILCELRCELR